MTTCLRTLALLCSAALIAVTGCGSGGSGPASGMATYAAACNDVFGVPAENQAGTQ